MPRKKTIEAVHDTRLPKALIINGGEVSDFLAKTLEEQGCEVKKAAANSPLLGVFDYVFLFDNQDLADRVLEKNVDSSGKFLLILTGELGTLSPPRFKVLKIGDPAFLPVGEAGWSLPELSEKILSAIFSSGSTKIIDLGRKPKVAPVKKPSIYHPVPVAPLEEPPKEIPKLVIVEKTRHSSFKKILATIFIFLVIGFIIFSAGIYVYAKQVEKTASNLNWHLKSGNFQALTSDIKQAKGEIAAIQDAYNFGGNIFFPLKDNSSFKDTGILLVEAEKIIRSGEEFSLAVSDLLPSQSGFAESTQNINREKLANLDKQATDFAATLITSRENLDKLNLFFLPRDDIEAALFPIIPKLIAAHEMLPVATDIFFTPTPKIYLVLFQNNMELRPTGGFIGSYGLLTIANGKISDFKIEDVYTADGQLKGHVDPPAPIRKYLSQPNFFLRDSNFDPDFAASSIQAAFFLEKELGKKVDGVIGVNLTLAQKLLQVTGPIALSDFSGEEITADNFFYKVHYLSSNNFFPGSTAKKDVLTAVNNEIFNKLTDNFGANVVELLPVVKQALDEKNILLFSEDDAMQKILEDHGWAGRMVKISCTARKNETGAQTVLEANTCLADYLSIIEANLGVNKANYFVEKSTVLEERIDASGKITNTITVSYENSNSTLQLPSETYVNYLRFFVPLGSKLVNVTLNSIPVPNSEVDTGNYSEDKTVFGFLVKIAPDNKGVVKITYTLPRLINSKISDFQLYFQKQAGDKNSPFIFSVAASDGYTFKPVNFSSTTSKNDEIFYATDSSVDRVFALIRE